MKAYGRIAFSYDAIVTSYLGDTATRLRRMFDFVRTEPCVLFFDEFDALGKERGDLHETEEIKRVVTTFLMQLDDLPFCCVLVGATNHPELLDRAAWRRFEIKLELGKPSDDQMTDYFALRMTEFNDNFGYTAMRLRAAICPKNISEAEDFFMAPRSCARQRHVPYTGQGPYWGLGLTTWKCDRR